MSLNAAANAEGMADEPDWIPSISVGLEAFDWKSEESVRNQVNGPFLDAVGEGEINSFVLMLGGEIATPPISIAPGKPRIVIGGGVGFLAPAGDELLRLGEASSGTNPEADLARFDDRLARAIRRNCLATPTRPENCPRLDLDGVAGQGADIRASFDAMTWGAKLGISFAFPVSDDFELQIRPGISYRGERVKLQGRLTTVTLDQFVLPPDRFGTAIVDTTIYRSRPGARNTVYHNLGPSLELGAVLSKRARPVRTTVYVHASHLWLLNGEVEEFSDSDGFATYRVRRENSAFRGGIGIRFSWVGFER